MRRATKHLDSKRRLNAARALFQVSDVLFFGFANATQRSAKTDSDAILRLFAGILKAGILQGELRRDDSELRVTIKPFQPLRRKKLLGIPIANFTGTSHPKHAGIKTRDAADPAPFRHDSIPKPIETDSDAGNRTDTGDDRASSGLPRGLVRRSLGEGGSLWRRRAHAVTLFAFAST
jgi:hypothetical protein